LPYILKELENKGIIFLEGLEGLENWEEKRLKIPGITVSRLSKGLNPSVLPDIKLLRTLDHALSPDQNELLTILIVVFRLWTIYQNSVRNGFIKEGKNGTCNLSDLFPLRENQDDVKIEFEPRFSVLDTPFRIGCEADWIKFKQKCGMSECIAFQNLEKAPFADAFLLTQPLIFFQSKQELTSCRKEIDDRLPNILKKGLVKTEHAKVVDAAVGEHFFVLDTDAHARDDEKYNHNEIVVTSDNRREFLGDVMAQIKMYSVLRG